MNINVKKALEEDSVFDKGNKEYEKIVDQAHKLSVEITEALISEVPKKNEDGTVTEGSISLTVATMAVMRAAINLCSYMYDNEQDFKDDIIKSRTCVIDNVVPAILNPQPCGKCEECMTGKPCTHPAIDTHMMQTRVVPMIACSLVEYDLWNKVLYMYTEEGKKRMFHEYEKMEESEHGTNE